MNKLAHDLILERVAGMRKQSAPNYRPTVLNSGVKPTVLGSRAPTVLGGMSQGTTLGGTNRGMSLGGVNRGTSLGGMNRGMSLPGVNRGTVLGGTSTGTVLGYRAPTVLGGRNPMRKRAAVYSQTPQASQPAQRMVSRTMRPKKAVPKEQWARKRNLSNGWISSQGYGSDSPGDRMLANANADIAKHYEVAKWRTANLKLLKQYPQLEQHAYYFAQNPAAWTKFQRSAGLVR